MNNLSYARIPPTAPQNSVGRHTRQQTVSHHAQMCPQTSDAHKQIQFNISTEIEFLTRSSAALIITGHRQYESTGCNYFNVYFELFTISLNARAVLLPNHRRSGALIQLAAKMGLKLACRN